MPQMHTMQKLGFETAHQSAREHEWQSRGSEMSINHPLPLQLQSHRGSRPLPHSPWQMFRKPLLLYFVLSSVISPLLPFLLHLISISFSFHSFLFSIFTILFLVRQGLISYHVVQVNLKLSMLLPQPRVLRLCRYKLLHLVGSLIANKVAVLVSRPAVTPRGSDRSSLLHAFLGDVLNDFLTRDLSS